MDAIAFVLGVIAPIVEPRETVVALPKERAEPAVAQHAPSPDEPRWTGHWAAAKYL